MGQEQSQYSGPNGAQGYPPHTRDPRRQSKDHPPKHQPVAKAPVPTPIPNPVFLPSPAPAVQEKPGLMARMRAAAGGFRVLEDVCSVDKGAKPLGKGTFGTVYRGTLKNGHKVAVKVIEKAGLKRLHVPVSIVSTECEMMRECAGKEGFVQLYDIVETDTRFCLLLEICDGGDVQNSAMAAEGMLGEKQVRFLMKQMIDSICYLHSKDIVHRDVKPHNYLLVGDIRTQHCKVKLGDFGTALKLEKGKLLKDQVGTPAFMAPEIHLLPKKSSGYDHKVDVWAVGVCMIFLLANEYPFIDGSGRLLRHRIIKGDVPLWEANAFQNLFQGAQEVLGLVKAKKRPSKLAKDLVRALLAPRRQDRFSAWAALQHDWFTKPIVETTGYEDVTDNLPILDMKEFDDALSMLERDVGWAVDIMSKVEMGSVEEVQHFDRNDDRIQSCVVCYGKAGDFSYVCSQCTHAVCMGCLQKMPKPICPHCRHEATDMTITHGIAQLGRIGSQHSTQLLESATSLANMPIHFDAPDFSVPIVHEDSLRKQTCLCCRKPASSTNYMCPACCMSMCFECTKEVLVAQPRCPGCGEYERVAATVPQYIAANEAWAQAAQIGDSITRTFSDMTSLFSNGQHTDYQPSRQVSKQSADSRQGSKQHADYAADSWQHAVSHQHADSRQGSKQSVDSWQHADSRQQADAWQHADSRQHADVHQYADSRQHADGPPGRQFSAARRNTDPGPMSPDREVRSSSSRRRSMTDTGEPRPPAEGAQRSHTCCVCRVQASMFDHVCPCCRAAVCTKCICSCLPREDMRCPSCNDAANNAQSMRLIADGHKAHGSWSNFWGGIFGGSVHPAISLLSPTSACQQVALEENEEVTVRRAYPY